MSKQQFLSLIVFVATAVWITPPHADAQRSQSSPQSSTTNPSLPKDAPFGRARGVFPPLMFSIDGLNSGVAKVGAGSRQFAVCWQGGASPYEVRLSGLDGAPVFDRKGLGSTRLSFGPDRIQLKPGAYVISVTDDTGISRQGRFSVVETSRLPASARDDDRRLARARQLADMPNYAYAFEAYLTLAPLLDSPAPDLRALADRLCHAPS